MALGLSRDGLKKIKKIKNKNGTICLKSISLFYFLFLFLDPPNKSPGPEQKRNGNGLENEWFKDSNPVSFFKIKSMKTKYKDILCED